MNATACWACVVGLHEECYTPTPMDETPEFDRCCCHDKKADDDAKAFVNDVGRPMSAPGDVKDVTSTGRKRAAMVAPIFSGMLCEWAGLKYAGGGIQPMVGCRGNTIVDTKGGTSEHKQGDLHHGPDKNTLNNSVGVNLHRICVDCHHRWHGLNDKGYGKRPESGDEQFLPIVDYVKHDPDTIASEEDFELTEAWWRTRQEKRGAYPVALNE